jgi:dUTP pyrophosphatase
MQTRSTPKLEVIISSELAHHGLPAYGTRGSAAIDLRALLNSPSTEAGPNSLFHITKDENDRVVDVTLNPGETITVDSGLKIHIKDPEWAGLIVPRSSAANRGIGLGNTVGLVDSDYQGPLKLKIKNTFNRPIVIVDGERVAQYVLIRVQQFEMDVVQAFTDESERGEAAFGSTGVV